MPTEAVNVIVKARDEASRKFKNIGKAGLNMGSMLKKAAAMAGLYFGGRAIKRLSQESVSLYAMQEKAERQLQQTLISTGHAAGFSYEALKKYAGELQQVTRFGDEVTISAMSILATFKEIKGPVFKEATEIAMDMSEALQVAGGSGQDLKSSMVQLGKALNDPLTGLTALQRVGITFSEQQKTQIKAAVAQNNILKAQRLILDELSSQFGGQARAAAEGTGAIDQMKNAIGDLKESIGWGLMPVVIDSAKRIKTWAEDNQERIGAWVRKASEGIILAKDIFAGFVSYMKTDWKDGLAFALRAFLDVLKATMYSAVDIVGEGMKAIYYKITHPEANAAESYMRIMSERLPIIWQATIEKISREAPAGLGASTKAAFAKYQERIAGLSAPGAPTAGIGKGWGLARGIGASIWGAMNPAAALGAGPGRAGSLPLEARFLSMRPGAAADPVKQTELNTNRIATATATAANLIQKLIDTVKEKRNIDPNEITVTADFQT